MMKLISFSFILRTFLTIALPLFAFLNVDAQEDISWSVLQPGFDDFSVDTPVRLKLHGDQGAKSNRSYNSSTKETYFYIFSDPIKNTFQFDNVVRFAQSSGHDLSLPAVGERRDGVRFVDADGYSHIIVLLRTANRLYIAQTTSSLTGDPVALRFCNSFRFADSDQGEQSSLPSTETTTAAADKGAVKPVPPKSIGSGNGSASGSGKGNGNGPGGIGSGGSSPGTSSDQTVPLKIISKPRALYNDFARFYSISGTVTLRVTFLSNGQIGSVSVINKLPFGLTKSAIEAAKQVQFEPMKRNGNPVNVVKMFQYNFVLY